MKLFTPGPIAMDPETIKIGGTQAQYFRTPEFSQIMLDCMDMLKKVLDAPDDARMIFLTSSGTGAMEASVMNLFTPKDKILIISGGTFGRRFKQICEVYHIPIVSIDLAWNESFNEKMLQRYENSGITGMLVNICETSTGQLYPMDIISDFCRRNHICLVVDAISSFLCDAVGMKAIGAAAIITSSQKGFGLQPGMSFIMLTEKVYKERCEKNEVKSIYFRFTDYVKDIERGQTPYTPAVGIINQLHEKLTRILKDGLRSQISYIEMLSSYFRKELVEKTTFTIPSYPLSNCLTPIYCKKNNAIEIVETLKKGMTYITPCAGEIASFLLRVVHMSRQISIGDIDELIGLLQEFN